ncbi:MAG TPA: hypothetical protein VF593_12995 [Chthoniobacteraceae bacterium]|jgi:hypothetical protein
MIPSTDDALMNLIDTVKDGVARRGFHILLREELTPVFDGHLPGSARMRRLQLFTSACGAHCEADRELTVARFLPKAEEDDSESLTLVNLTQTAFTFRPELLRERVSAA